MAQIAQQKAYDDMMALARVNKALKRFEDILECPEQPQAQEKLSDSSEPKIVSPMLTTLFIDRESEFTDSTADERKGDEGKGETDRYSDLSQRGIRVRRRGVF